MGWVDGKQRLIGAEVAGYSLDIPDFLLPCLYQEERRAVALRVECDYVLRRRLIRDIPVDM